MSQMGILVSVFSWYFSAITFVSIYGTLEVASVLDQTTDV